MPELTREELVERARRVARERGSPALSKKDFTLITGITDSVIYSLFPDGGWREVLERADLERHRVGHPAKALTPGDIVEAARQAAGESGTAVLSKKDFARLTGISTGQIYKLFPDGGWREVLALAGLENHPKDLASRPELTREDIVKAAKQAATEIKGAVLSKKQFTRISGIGHRSIDGLFPDGGWHKIQELAGLGRHPQDAERRSDEEILEEIHRVVTSIGHFPSRWVFRDRAAFSSRTLEHRFGGMEGAERRYQAWLAEREEVSTARLQPSPDVPEHDPPPLLVRVSAGDVPEHKPLPSPPRASGSMVPTHGYRPNMGEFVYGPAINFRGLRHAPINEQGVIYLFGMVSYELGFLVEAIHQQYPDCEAKRCIDLRQGRWKRVLVEFEYRSRHFLEHGHDPSACNIIVCWEHDWKDCPLTLEIVELRKEIDRLDPSLPTVSSRK